MQFSISFATMLAAAASLVATAPVDKSESRGVAYDWGSSKVRGVNIGGWLVLEPFITPSVFETYSSNENHPVDEWTLCQQLGKQGCYNALKPHWDNFVKLEDFQKIETAGFNTIRIPIGYWAYLEDDAPYTTGAAPYLDKAIEWARQTGLKVIVDLHGVPQSQNGFDHSGHRSSWPQWGHGDSISKTHQVLKILEEKYATRSMQDVVIAIQPLNEPFLEKLDAGMVQQFYRDSFYNLRLISDTPIVLHDGFRNPSWLNNFLTPWDNNAQGVVIDHHEYQIFTQELLSLSPEAHGQLACQAADGPDGYSTSDKWTIVGEWSGAMTDCAPHLNGFRSGNRYEGTREGSYRIGSCEGKTGRVSSWSQQWKDEVRSFLETQLEAFEAKTNGYIFWNFKTEGDAGEWDMFQLLDNGVFPHPLDQLKFGKLCTNF